ncbi:MAG: hypothetical protein QW379_01870 [Thermoplasmata archaeon]
MLDRSHFCGKCGTYKRYDPVKKRKYCPRCRHREEHEALVHGRGRVERAGAVQNGA